MTEKEFAKNMERDYLDAKKQFSKPNISNNLTNIKEAYNLDYDKLKVEVEKLGYHLELAKNINKPYWQDIWKLGPFFVFYANEADL